MYLSRKDLVKDIFFLTLIISLFFGTLLGIRALSVPDEARYTEIPRYMVVSGDYVTPRLNGIKYFEKPPLMYWLEASSIKLFGVQEWALRFWPAFLGLLTCLATYFSAARLYSRQVGIFAAIILASSILFNFISRLIILDVAVTCFLTLTLYSFLLATQAKTKKQQTVYLAFFFINAALSVLSKGLIGIVIPGAIIILWAVVTRQYRQILLGFKLWGIFLFFAIAAPWHILVARENPEFLWFYFVHEHFLRYLTSVHGRSQTFFYFTPLVVFGWFPWVAYFLVSFWENIKKFWREKFNCSSELAYLLIWPLFIFFFFSISNSKLIPYITPAFPPLAILVGKTISEIWDGQRDDRRIISLSCGVSFLFIVAVCLVAYKRGLLFEDAFRWHFISLLAILSMFMGAIPLLRKRVSSRAAIVGNILLSFCLITAIQLGWELADPRSSKELVLQIAALKQPHDKVATINNYYQDIAPYLNQKICVIDYTPNELQYGIDHEDTTAWMISSAEFIKQCQLGQIFYIILSKSQLDFFDKKDALDFKVIATKGNTLLMTNRK